MLDDIVPQTLYRRGKEAIRGWYQVGAENGGSEVARTAVVAAYLQSREEISAVRLPI